MRTISGNARQVKECKTDLSPEGSSSSGSINSNIKGQRNFMLHSTNHIQQSRVWSRRFSGLREALRPFKKSKPRNTRHVFKKIKVKGYFAKISPTCYATIEPWSILQTKRLSQRQRSIHSQTQLCRSKPSSSHFVAQTERGLQKPLMSPE